MKQINSVMVLMGLIAIVILASVMIIVKSLQTDPDQELIYMVIKTNEEDIDFWRSMKEGARIAGVELNMEVVVVGAERETDLEGQIRLIREGISLKPKAIVVAASDYYALSEVIGEVNAAKIPFVTVDSDIKTEVAHSFVATNNIQAAQRLGHEMGSMLKGSGQIGIISHLKGSFTSIEREAGFIKGIATFSHLKMLEEIYYTDNEEATAYEQTLYLIENYPDLRGVFATNETTLNGAARVLAKVPERGILLMGFDISKNSARYVEEGVVHAVMAQRPFNMGYLSVKEAVDIANKVVEPRVIDTKAVLINQENIYNEENQKLLIPFVN